MTFLEAGWLVVGRNVSNWQVFRGVLVGLLVLSRTVWERFGALDGCLLVELLGDREPS